MTHVLEMTPQHVYTCTCGADDCKDKKFRSVTTILGKSVPKDLGWWGMTIGAEGVRQLVNEGRIDLGRNGVDVVDALKKAKLTVNHKKEDGGRRGTGIHDALEALGRDGTLPSLTSVPKQDRGYLRGLMKFIVGYRPVFEATEVRVLSLEHEFAGTFDFIARIGARLESQLVNAGRYGKRPVLRLVPDPSGDAILRVLGDLKTSKWVYPASHFAQLEAYELGRIEMGEAPTDLRAVLHVNSRGDMELVPATFRDPDGSIRLARADDFLALRRSAEAIAGLESSYQRPKRKT